MPSFTDYYEKYGKIPNYLTIGFSYLMAIYSSLVKGVDGKFYACLPGKKVEYKDDLPYLEYFANGGNAIEFMKKVDVWGEDLTKYEGFALKVEENLKKILNGESLI